MRQRFCLARPDPGAPGGFRKVCELLGDVRGVDKSRLPEMYEAEVPSNVGVAVGWRYIGRASNLDVTAVRDGEAGKVVITCSRPEG